MREIIDEGKISILKRLRQRYRRVFESKAFQDIIKDLGIAKTLLLLNPPLDVNVLRILRHFRNSGIKLPLLQPSSVPLLLRHPRWGRRFQIGLLSINLRIFRTRLLMHFPACLLAVS